MLESYSIGRVGFIYFRDGNAPVNNIAPERNVKGFCKLLKKVDITLL